MRFDFQFTWVRLVIEFFPRTLPIRRYRVIGEDIRLARRRMVRRIHRHLRHAPNSL